MTTTGNQKTKSGLAHRCADGTHSPLMRQGPKGMVGVTLSCDRCGFSEDGAVMYAKMLALKPLIVAALSPRG
jgi:hypothetical protein